MTDYDPLTPEEVNEAAKQEFFPLFDIVHRNMPENCTVEDTIKGDGNCMWHGTKTSCI